MEDEHTVELCGALKVSGKYYIQHYILWSNFVIYIYPTFLISIYWMEISSAISCHWIVSKVEGYFSKCLFCFFFMNFKISVFSVLIHISKFVHLSSHVSVKAGVYGTLYRIPIWNQSCIKFEWFDDICSLMKVTERQLQQFIIHWMCFASLYSLSHLLNFDACQNLLIVISCWL